MHHRKIIRSFVKYIMPKYIMIILTSISLVWGQCEDGEVELWEECYSIAFTYELDLSEQGLSGNLPADISLLSNLMFLDLSYNQIEGEIPEELGSLTNLLGLDLSNNVLSGSIPGELGSLTSLMTLNVSENQLTGSLPPELGYLTGLVDLSLFSNELSGELPSELGDLVYLSEFIAHDNQLTGSIPEQFGSLESLNYLYLHNNLLTGEIPGSICDVNLDWSDPNNFNVDGNQLCPPYPDCLSQYVGYQDIVECPGVYELWGGLYYAEGVVELDLSESELEGPIPSVIGNFINLTFLDLSNNQISGSIPDEIGNLTSLGHLDLSFNDLTGSIPASIGGLTMLTELRLYANSLSGALPTEIGNLNALQYLNVFNNDLSGVIPSEIGNLEELHSLYMHQNEFEGSLPDEFYELTELVQLYLNNNQFSGSISPNIGGFQSLERLRMQNNNFSGELSEEICDLPLQWDDPAAFNITNNNFCAPYPYCIDGYEGNQDTTSCGEDVYIQSEIEPMTFNIERSYPNPFNPYTVVTYTIPYNVKVQIYISDIVGRRVVTLVNGNQDRGRKNIKWDGRNSYGRSVSAGVYYCTLLTDQFIKTHKLVLLK